jgi:hypothetical protein
MATNADGSVVDDDKEVTAEDLRDLKYGDTGVETSDKADETDTTEEETDDEDSKETGDDNETNSDSEADETEEDSDDSQFVKKFPNIKGETLEDYARSLEAAYDNSTAEFQRLRQSKTEVKETGKPEDKDTKASPADPVSLYIKQKMDEEIVAAYSDFSKVYSQVNDAGEYARFTQKVDTLQKLALAEGRISPPKELYNDAAAALHWEAGNKVDSKDKLGIALKNKAAVTKTTSATKKASRSKVTDAMVAANRLMYPEKTDAQIREELEPYVQ